MFFPSTLKYTEKNTCMYEGSDVIGGFGKIELRCWWLFVGNFGFRCIPTDFVGDNKIVLCCGITQHKCIVLCGLGVKCIVF